MNQEYWNQWGNFRNKINSLPSPHILYFIHIHIHNQQQSQQQKNGWQIALAKCFYAFEFLRPFDRSKISSAVKMAHRLTCKHTFSSLPTTDNNNTNSKILERIEYTSINHSYESKPIYPKRSELEFSVFLCAFFFFFFLLIFPLPLWPSSYFIDEL